LFSSKIPPARQEQVREWRFENLVSDAQMRASRSRSFTLQVEHQTENGARRPGLSHFLPLFEAYGGQKKMDFKQNCQMFFIFKFTEILSHKLWPNK